MNEEPANIWQFLILVWNALYSHGTRILGLIQGTLVILSASDVIPPAQLKWYVLATAVLTFWQGRDNADKIAEKLAAKMAPKVPLAQPVIPANPTEKLK